MLHPESLSDELGFNVYFKCECLQPTGAFKVRGGINFMENLSDKYRGKGVVTASTGNHAQSIAYAARLYGVPAIIFMPEANNPMKVAATRKLGATVIEAGDDFDESRLLCEEYASDHGMRYIHSANEPWLIAGVGTYALEFIEQEPELDVVIVPVGAGSGVCGTATVFKALRPETKIIGVQAANMPAVHDSYHQRELVSYEGGSTWAEGLATRVAFDLPFQLMQEIVDDMVLVSEEDMRQSLITLLGATHLAVEGAGAAAFAAANRLTSDLQGLNVGVVISGGNVTVDTLKTALCDERSWN